MIYVPEGLFIGLPLGLVVIGLAVGYFTGRGLLHSSLRQRECWIEDHAVMLGSAEWHERSGRPEMAARCRARAEQYRQAAATGKMPS